MISAIAFSYTRHHPFSHDNFRLLFGFYHFENPILHFFSLSLFSQRKSYRNSSFRYREKTLFHTNVYARSMYMAFQTHTPRKNIALIQKESVGVFSVYNMRMNEGKFSERERESAFVRVRSARGLSCIHECMHACERVSILPAKDEGKKTTSVRASISL